MASYKELVMAYLDGQGVKYCKARDTQGRDNVICIDYTGDNLKTIPVYVFFDPDGEPMVKLKCWDIASFKGEKRASGINACNELNSEYRWTRFYIDKDCDVIAQVDAYVDTDSCGSTCKFLADLMTNIIDKGYPIFMKALYNQSEVRRGSRFASDSL